MAAGEVSAKETVVAVRRALVRRWIEVSVLDIHFYRGLLRLRGTLKFLSGSSRAIDASFLSSLEHDLRKIPGVKQVDWDLSNWTKMDDGWRSR